MRKNIRSFIIGGFVASSLGALAVNIPNTFSAGTPIKASEINANFTSLKTAVDALEASPLPLPTSLEGTNPNTATALLQISTKDIGTAIYGISKDPTSAASGVQGESYSPGGFGVYGLSRATAGSGTGVYGQGGIGVWGKSISGRAGVLGINESSEGGSGVEGKVSGNNAAGVVGDSPNGNGVIGTSARAGYAAVFGKNPTNGYGVYGESAGTGVYGKTTTGGAGVFGENTGNTSGSGVQGNANGTNAAGVYGVNPTGPGTWGRSTSGSGAYGESTSGYGGQFKSQTGAALRADATGSAAIWAFNNGGACTVCASQGGSGDIFRGWGQGSNLPKFWVDTDGNVNTVAQYFGKGFNNTSDRNAKQNFSSINALGVLERVVNLPISRWNYKSDSASTAHIGPMAQDFHAAFGLNGSDDTHINTVDAQGVALAAIQGLNQKLEAENAKLRASLADLEARLVKLERR